MQIAQLLANGKRTSLIGRNMYTYEGYGEDGTWQSPRPGLTAQRLEGYTGKHFGICLGHQLDDVTCGAVPQFTQNSVPLSFTPVRHKWTPAWQDTWYRSEPDASVYAGCGLLAFREQKCITPEDVFCSHIELHNDSRSAMTLEVTLSSQLEGAVEKEIHVGALGRPLLLRGYGVLQNTIAAENTFTLTVPPHGHVTFRYAFAFSKADPSLARQQTTAILAHPDPFTTNEQAFDRFMQDHFPTLETENFNVLKIYYYRCFLLYRAIHCPAAVIEDHPIPGDCLYESPYGSWYGCPVGLPVPLHTEEAKWMTDPQVLYADLDNWFHKITNYQDYIQYTPLAVWHAYDQHRDKALLTKAYDACRAYTLRSLHPDKDGPDFFPTTYGSWVTGAEYQPAFYQHAAEKWDWTCDMEGISKGLATKARSLYRLDTISYALGNLMGMVDMANALEMSEDHQLFSALLAKGKKILNTHFWSPQRQAFVSLDVETGLPCDEALCYDSFFPFLWQLCDEEHLDGLAALTGFSAPFGMTSVERNCPMYWFDNCIAGPTKSSPLQPHHYGCCWNGPVWPYAMSGVLEALGGTATTHPEWQAKWMMLFDQYTDLHFLDGDPSVPMITEHYRPTDGHSFSCTCDYFHSVWLDLFFHYWAGIHVTGEKIHFSPFTNEKFTLRHVSLLGKTYTFVQDPQATTHCMILEETESQQENPL